MNKNKLGSSLNKQEEILNFLKSDLPEVFSEGKIDCKKLKQTLGEEVDDGNERYGLSWNGKSNCYKVIQEQTTATLKPAKDESVNFDQTQNLFIEGDNLEVLKVLQRSYYGKVKMIYIDPPYNTGGDFIYNDDFRKTKQEELKESGELNGDGDLTRADGLSLNRKDSNGHFHSDWLNMMYPRLFLARNLLQQDGVIFASIDDNEVKNLRMIMDEIFGEENFISEFVWHNNVKGRQMDLYVKNTFESILMYAKNFESLVVGTQKDLIDTSNLEKDEISYFKKDYPLHNGTADFHINNRPNLAYSIYYNPETGEAKTINEKVEKDGTLIISDPSKDGISLIEQGFVRIIPKYNQTYKNQRVWRWGSEKFLNEYKTELLFERESDGYYIYQKKRFLNGIHEKTFKNYINIDSGTGKKELNDLLGGKLFNSPKPTALVKTLLQIGTENNDIVLDFFVGSGTTADAVMQLNAEDGSKRRFICVQLPELCDEESEAYKAGYKNIAEISKERIRKAGKKIEKENENKVDLGFKVLKLDKSNFKVWQGKFENTENLLNAMTEFVDNVQKGSKEENILLELILKSGLDLNVPVEEKEYGGEKYYSLDGGKLIVYLGKKITKELSEEIQKAKPEKFICLDGCFQNNDQLKTNISLQMEQEKIDFKVI